jgi:hypothetical protein
MAVGRAPFRLILHESVLSRVDRGFAHLVLIALDDMFRRIFEPHRTGQQRFIVLDIQTFSDESQHLALRVELRLHRAAFAVLGVLDDEHHPELDDRCTRVDAHEDADSAAVVALRDEIAERRRQWGVAS